MLNFSESFENGVIIDSNQEYGFIKFVIDPSAIVIKKYPIIIHNTANKTSTLWTNNIDMLPAAGTYQLHEPNQVTIFDSWVIPEDSKALSQTIDKIVPYSSYLSYQLTQGEFMLCKKVGNDNYISLKQFAIGADEKAIEYTDYYTDEQLDAILIYAIAYRAQSSNDWLIIAEQAATIDFEDILLTGVDEEDQSKLLTLRIRYNPQISSFKTIVQEEKIDTIGSKYPFFVRNGTIGYKEIPLGGLLSYRMDNLHMFLDSSIINKYFPNELQRGRTKSRDEIATISISDEFFIERQFKRRVEKWLNNGKPKLLRTAAEGNFIVRLMNVSLTPMEQLGRRLHSFTATAYEIDEYDNLETYFSQLAAPVDVYATTLNTDVTTIYQITSIPYSVAMTSGQYIQKQVVDQLGLSKIQFTSKDQKVIYYYNGGLFEAVGEQDIKEPVLLNFGRIVGEIGTTLSGTQQKIFLTQSIGQVTSDD